MTFERSLCVARPLMLVIICAWYGKNPSRTVGATEQTRPAGQTDGRTRWTEWNKYAPPISLLCGVKWWHMTNANMNHSALCDISHMCHFQELLVLLQIWLSNSVVFTSYNMVDTQMDVDFDERRYMETTGLGTTGQLAYIQLRGN